VPREYPEPGEVDSRVALACEAWQQELQQHLSSHAALKGYHLGLCAPKAFMTHCLALLEQRLQILLCPAAPAGLGLRYFFLQPRGSVVTGTALRSSVDLDVDIILTRDRPEFQFVSLPALHICAKPTLTGDAADRAARFNATLNAIRDLLANSSVFRFSDVKNLSSAPTLTRSVSFKMLVDNTWMDVDLFPKLQCQAGFVWAPMKSQQPLVPPPAEIPPIDGIALGLPAAAPEAVGSGHCATTGPISSLGSHALPHCS
jgi:hypothetical protein